MKMRLGVLLIILALALLAGAVHLRVARERNEIAGAFEHSR